MYFIHLKTAIRTNCFPILCQTFKIDNRDSSQLQGILKFNIIFLAVRLELKDDFELSSKLKDNILRLEPIKATFNLDLDHPYRG